MGAEIGKLPEADEGRVPKALVLAGRRGAVDMLVLAGRRGAVDTLVLAGRRGEVDTLGAHEAARTATKANAVTLAS